MKSDLQYVWFDAPDETWLDYVSDNRNGIATPKHDFAFGPVANDDVFRTFAAYQAGVLSKEETNIIASITITNNGKKKIIDKEAFLVYSPELELKNNFNSFKFDIDINEDPIKIDFELQPKEVDGIIKTGYYDIILFCEDTIIKEEILIREG